MVARRIVRAAAGGAVLALGFAVGVAWAANGLHPRTRVVWDSDGVCGLLVVKSEGTAVELPYSLPDANQDGMIDGCDDDPTPSECPDDPPPNQPIGADEVDGSRRHQFFAMCRQHAASELLPNWISQADVDASAQVETCCDPNVCPGPMCPLVDPMLLDADDLVDTAPAWEGCIERVSADDDRRPITAEQAQQGVTWDVTDVSPGVWAVAGYTFEPPFNEWSRRPGFVKVVDEAADASSFPAVAISGIEEAADDDRIVAGCEAITVKGCVDAGEDAMLSLWWRHPEPGEPIAWHRVAADVPVEGSTFELTWEPQTLPDGFLMLRVDVEDACGSFSAHAPFSLEVLPGDECEDGAVFMGGDDGDEVIDDQDSRNENHCAGDSGGDEGDGPGGGCGCAQGRAHPGGAAWLLFPVLAGRGLARRRRRG
jgi:hypothetical protein